MAWYRTGGGGIDTSDATLNNGNQMLNGVTAYANDIKYTGTIETKTASDITVSGDTVTTPAGYYASQVSKNVEAGTQGTPTATKSISGNTATITPSATDTTGYITGTTKTGDAVTVSASELVDGTTSITTTAATDVTNSQYAQIVDSNLSVENIKSGTTILGITGTYKEIEEVTEVPVLKSTTVIKNTTDGFYYAWKED